MHNEVTRSRKILETDPGGKKNKYLNSISFTYFKAPFIPLYYIPFLRSVPMEDNTIRL